MNIKRFFINILFIGLSIFGIQLIKESKFEYEENNRIEVASIAIDIANNSKDYSDIDNAKDLVSVIETDNIKTNFLLEIDSIEEEMNKEKIKESFNIKIEDIKNNLNREELSLFVNEVNLVDYDDVKVEYLKICDDLLKYIEQKEKEIQEEKKKQEQLSYYNRMKNVDATVVNSNVPNDVTVLETLSGKVTAFTPYCSDGCGGYTATGKYVGNGDIFQYDNEYGMVYIVAGGPEYPFGTIVRFKNVGYFGKDIYAIVLDRGGAIGKNRRALFDLLFANEDNANRFGVQYLTCEILRIGY